MKDFYQAANVAFPDFDITVWGEYDMPGCSVRQVAISGTHKGDWCGIPGTGRHVRWQLAGLFLFGTGQQAGKLLAERIYFDNETIMRQLRGEMDEASVVDFPTASGKGCAIRRVIHAAGRVMLERCLPHGAASVYHGRFFRDQTPRVQGRRILLRPA